MSPALSLRRRAQTDAADVGEQPADGLPPIASGRDQTTSHLAAKAATAGLLACLVLAPVGAALGGFALLQSSQPARPVGSAAVVDESNERAAAGEFAERVVRTWLTATRAEPDALVALVKDAAASALPEEAFTVTDSTVAGIERTAGIWSVTVAATVTDARRQTARRFYQVPVVVAGGAVTALTLPAAVSAPMVGAPPRTEYATQLGSRGAAGVTVAQFLQAYLSGTGDVSRYLTPGISITALAPPPYTAVSLTDLRGVTRGSGDAAPSNGQRMRVLATATGTVTARQAITVVYALSLTARAGRWEITAIDPVPAVAPQTPGAVGAPGTSPPPSGGGAFTPSGTSIP